ncbi:hypothetical protein Pgy4_41569, partial [Pseudomonas savastanoi pv. glycinea str. race 4]
KPAMDYQADAPASSAFYAPVSPARPAGQRGTLS